MLLNKLEDYRLLFKAAIIYIFIITVDQMIHSDEATENYALNMQLLSALRSFIVSALCLSVHNFTVLVHPHRCHSVIFREKTGKSHSPLPAPTSNSRQTQLETSW